MHHARHLCGDRHTTWSTSLDNSRESQDSILLQWHCWARGTGEGTVSATLRVCFFFKLLILSCQAFFATRVAKCFDKPYLALLCWTLTAFRFFSCLVMTAVSVKAHEQEWAWVLTAGLVIEASVDLLI